MNILVTGGCGFIGSRMIRYLLDQTPHSVVNVDSLTYAGSMANVKSVQTHPRYSFYHVNICEEEAVLTILKRHRIDCVMHLAAETHVDRSIISSDPFIQSNVVGTQRLLEAARRYLDLPETTVTKSQFRWLQVSTDEVFGDRGANSLPSLETDPYMPSSPYSASKASADHLVRAYERTHGIQAVITYATNNFGPSQHPEKLIPLTVQRAMSGQIIPIYGSGEQIREWIHVDDHVEGLFAALTAGIPGQSYNLGSGERVTNLEIVETICEVLDQWRADWPCQAESSTRGLIRHVPDRLGHDTRYALDSSKAAAALNWRASRSLLEGLRETIVEIANNYRPPESTKLQSEGAQR